MMPLTLPGPTFEDIFDLGHVSRWHTKPMAVAQTLADHKAKVALLADRLGRHLKERYDDAVAYDTLLWGLNHDEPETTHGDVPNPAKQWLNANLPRPYDEMVAEDWWGERGQDVPEYHPLAVALGRVADALEAAGRYWIYGLDQQLRRDMIFEAITTTRRLLPELLHVVVEALEAAGVPKALVAEAAA